MRALLRIVVPLLAVVVALVAGPAGPATAKGAESVTITGPDIPAARPLELSARTDPDTFGRLDTGLYDALDAGGPPLAAVQPAGKLGTRHVLTWQLHVGPGGPTPVRQDLYLSAAGGPLAYTPPGQFVWADGSVAGGGWHRPPNGVVQVLADLKSGWASGKGDAVAGDMLADDVLADVAPEPEATPAGSVGDAVWPEVTAGTAAAALAAIGGLAALRLRRARRRERVAAVPL
jgi:hypothetical protein